MTKNNKKGSSEILADENQKNLGKGKIGKIFHKVLKIFRK